MKNEVSPGEYSKNYRIYVPSLSCLRILIEPQESDGDGGAGEKKERKTKAEVV